jgi:hypothetical protein
MNLLLLIWLDQSGYGGVPDGADRGLDHRLAQYPAQRSTTACLSHRTQTLERLLMYSQQQVTRG